MAASQEIESPVVYDKCLSLADCYEAVKGACTVGEFDAGKGTYSGARYEDVFRIDVPDTLKSKRVIMLVKLADGQWHKCENFEFVKLHITGAKPGSEVEKAEFSKMFGRDITKVSTRTTGFSATVGVTLFNYKDIVKDKDGNTEQMPGADKANPQIQFLIWRFNAFKLLVTTMFKNNQIVMNGMEDADPAVARTQLIVSNPAVKGGPQTEIKGRPGKPINPLLRFNMTFGDSKSVVLKGIPPGVWTKTSEVVTFKIAGQERTTDRPFKVKRLDGSIEEVLEANCWIPYRSGSEITGKINARLTISSMGISDTISLRSVLVKPPSSRDEENFMEVMGDDHMTHDDYLRLVREGVIQEDDADSGAGPAAVAAPADPAAISAAGQSALLRSLEAAQ